MKMVLNQLQLILKYEESLTKERERERGRGNKDNKLLANRFISSSFMSSGQEGDWIPKSECDTCNKCVRIYSKY